MVAAVGYPLVCGNGLVYDQIQSGYKATVREIFILPGQFKVYLLLNTKLSASPFSFTNVII